MFSGGDDVRTEKLKVIRALRPITEDDVRESTVRGQYVAGEINGKAVPGYLEDAETDSSDTDTFVAVAARNAVTGVGAYA